MKTFESFLDFLKKERKVSSIGHTIDLTFIDINKIGKYEVIKYPVLVDLRDYKYVDDIYVEIMSNEELANFFYILDSLEVEWINGLKIFNSGAIHGKHYIFHVKNKKLGILGESLHDSKRIIEEYLDGNKDLLLRFDGFLKKCELTPEEKEQRNKLFDLTKEFDPYQEENWL